VSAFGIDRRRLGLTALGLAAAGCSRPRRAVAGDAIPIAFAANIESLDPLMTIDGYPLFRSLFDSLTYIAADGSLAPRLARFWTVNADATEWTFRLRDDARWSDGNPVTMADVVFSLEWVRTTPASLNHQYLTLAQAIEPVGPWDIRFRLTAPFAAWPRQLSLLSIAPQRLYAANPHAFARRPMGSGPYGVAGWQPGGVLALAANPYHAGGPPPLPRIDIVSVPEEAARLDGLQSGDLDAITLTPQQAPLLRGRKDIAITTTQSNRVVYLGFQPSHGPLSDARVRHALDCAIDRDAICRFLLRGSATPIGQLVAPSTFGYDAAIPPTAYDPGRARALLSAAGYRGEPIVFQYPTNGSIPLSGLVAEAVQGYLQAAGVTVLMRGAEQNAFIGDWLTKKLQAMFLFAFAPSTLDAGLVTDSLLGPDGVRDFQDPVMDKLEALQQSQTVPADRAATFGRIWARNKQQAYYAPLFNDVYVYAAARAKVVLDPRRDGYITAQELRRPTPV
jgi:peptide/nickel transport system substrate-binding protein